MNLEKYREEMELELTWRSNEIRFLRNRISDIVKDDDKKKYRKSLVVMLYAHYEGYTKTCLQVYVSAINDLSLLRKEANESLIASSMDDIFKLYDDRDRKCRYFKRKIPDGTKFDNYFRRADLIMQFNEFLEQKLVISDNVVDTESNLWYEVLQKNLFRMGINYDAFSDYSSSIDKLVNLRNSIAHGSEKHGIEENFYTDLESDILKVMEALLKILIGNLKAESYLSNTKS